MNISYLKIITNVLLNQLIIFEILIHNLIGCALISQNIKTQRTHGFCGRKPTIVHYINGGRQSMIEQWPWQVHLKITDPEIHDSNYDYANCGASILSDVWLITAAHCFSDRKRAKVFLLIGQNITRKNNYREIKYDKIILHPKYEEFMGSHEYSTNDIALIKLNQKHRIRGRIIPLCLPQKDAIVPVNTVCYITGFGATSKDDLDPIKRIREGRVTIKNDRVCIKSLSLDYFDSKSMICAGKTKINKANSCQGDSGGPLVCEGNFPKDNGTYWYLFGITSFGALDCAAYSNSVYTRVANYVDWIQSVLEAA